MTAPVVGVAQQRASSCALRVSLVYILYIVYRRTYLYSDEYMTSIISQYALYSVLLCIYHSSFIH